MGVPECVLALPVVLGTDRCDDATGDAKPSVALEMGLGLVGTAKHEGYTRTKRLGITLIA